MQRRLAMNSNASQQLQRCSVSSRCVQRSTAGLDATALAAVPYGAQSSDSGSALPAMSTAQEPASRS